LLGIHHGELAQDGLAFAIRHMAIDFLEPASIDDVLTVRTERHAVCGARIVLDQKVLRGEACLAAARVTVALVGPGGRPLRIPPMIRAAFGA
jgi:acyl-CoA thioester hydrolase